MEFTLTNLWGNCARLYAYLNNQGGKSFNVYNARVNKIHFPISFKSARHVSITSGGDSTSNVYKHYIKIGYFNNDSFTCYADDTRVNIAYWLALGL